MRYSFVSAALVALISSAYAQTAGFDAITSPTQDQQIQAGSSFDIIWEPNGVTGTVTIKLLQGATFNTLQVGPVIASSIDNTAGTYTYTIPSESAFATYGFEIVLDSTAKDPNPTFQYSKPFHIVGGSSSSGSASGSASATGSGSPSSSGSTTTVRFSTGPSYTSSVSSTGSAVSTSISVSVVPSTTETVSKSASLTGSAGVSAETTASTSATRTTSSQTSASSSTSTSASANAAATYIATGGMARVGGMVLALAL